jgi:ribosomal protein L7/L12
MGARFGSTGGIKPNLKKTVAAFGARKIPIGPELAVVSDFRELTVSKAQQESLILSLVERGKVIEAIKLAQRAYKISLTEAKQFVDELQT